MISVPSQISNVVDFHRKAKGDYCNRYEKVLPAGPWTGKTIMLDSANVATCEVANEIFKCFGGKVIQVGNNPDGNNINDNCGTEHPDILMVLIGKTKAHIDISHEGDGDRVAIFDETGEKSMGMSSWA
jgi:phosphoglucosamine mutase